MAEQDQAAEKRLSIVKIYVKDFSFESPQAPAVFQAKDWAPQTNLNLRSANTKVDDDNNDNIHEVVLTLTVETKEPDSDKTIFLVELQQAGIFEIHGHVDQELGAVLGSFCPNLLFPYAREAISSVIQRGGFPEFIMQPINFDALYAASVQQAQQQLAEQAAEGNGEAAETH